jgi:adenylylsulfate kinase-like enzyme
MAREIIGCEHFLEVYLSTPLAVCESRDPKGFYRRARQGGLADFTGVSAPYEEPLLPDVVIDTNESDVECSVESLMQVLKKHVSA